MLLEDQRFIHEDLERLEQAISDRVAEDPRNIKDRLIRDHQVAGFLTRAQDQSKRLLDIYRDRDNVLAKEKQQMVAGEQYEEFYRQLAEIKDFHKKYPNEPVENLERAYKRRRPDDGEVVATEIDAMFTGEESNGRFLDMITLHEDFLNLPGISVRKPTYLQYLDSFDAFEPPRLTLKRKDKVSDKYLKYVSDLSSYLEGFLRRTKPLEDLPKQFQKIERDFESDWQAEKVPGWGKETNETTETAGPRTEGSGAGTWCADCEKEFSNENTYKAHLTGKKHVKNAQARKEKGLSTTNGTNGSALAAAGLSKGNLKERLIASHEYRVRAMADMLSNERSNTRVNVERKQGMTERERQAELDALFAEDDAAVKASHHRTADGEDSDGESDSSEKIYNPLKLPLAWDGKPIPYWLYKLHGLGVEFPCEICGNYVYMGRRAFDKHFSEQRHVYGLKCLGITGNASIGGLSLFREITGIQDAVNLWEKLKSEKRAKDKDENSIVQMEDAMGTVMPKRVYEDLKKQGLID